MIYSVDLETDLIRRGEDAAPPLACVTYCNESMQPQILHWTEAEAFLSDVFENHEIVGANFCYDACVIARAFPKLKHLISKAYNEDRVRDVQLAQRLLDLSRGELDGYRHSGGVFVKYEYSLGALYSRYDLGSLAKGEDTWRLRYGELINVPLKDWPEAAVSYAKLDALATLQIWQQQKHNEDLLLNLPAQTRHALSRYRMTCRGIVTSEKAIHDLLEETHAEIARCQKLLTEHGLLRGPETRPSSKIGTKDTKLAKDRMRRVCSELGIEPKLTDKGESLKKAGKEYFEFVSLDAEACRDSCDDVLKAYATFTSADTTVTKVEKLKEGCQGLPLQPSFRHIMANGRCSTFEGRALVGVQMQNLPRTGKMRSCFVARPGYALVSIDFNMHELVTVSQCELWLTGKSKLAEALNTGRDVHSDVASILLSCPYEEVLQNKKLKGSKYQLARDQSKEVNFGGWGVMTPQRLQLQMNKKRRVQDPIISFPRAQEIMCAWETRWEPHDYFAAVTAMFPDGNPWSRTTVRQFVTGRVRGCIDFPAACNTFFSGLASDGANAGVDVISDACFVAQPGDLMYDCHILWPTHDEVIMEVPLETLHESAYEATQLFVETAQAFTPDVKLSAAPAAMLAYSKEADTVLKDGKLQIWQP